MLLLIEQILSELVEDVILGCGMPEGATGHNIARNAAIAANCPVTVSGMTVNRYCALDCKQLQVCIKNHDRY